MIENFLPLDILRIGGAQNLQILVDNASYLYSIPFITISNFDINLLVYKDKEYIEMLQQISDFKKLLNFYNENKKSIIDIIEYKKYLNKILNNKSIQNRFIFSNKKTILGIGINGLGQLSQSPTDDNILMRDVARSAKEFKVYPSVENIDQTNSLNFSVKSLLGWKNTNLSCIAIGSSTDITKLMFSLSIILGGNSGNQKMKISDLINVSARIDNNFISNYLRNLLSNFLIDINDENLSEVINDLIDKNIEIENICNLKITSSITGTPFNKSNVNNKKNVIETTYGVFNRTINTIITIVDEMLDSLGKNNYIPNIKQAIKNTEKQFNLMICAFLIEHFDLTINIDTLNEPFVELDSNQQYKIKDEFKDDIFKKNSKNYNENLLLFYGNNFNDIYTKLLINHDINVKINNFLTSYSGTFNKQRFGIGGVVHNVFIFENTLSVVDSYTEKIKISKDIIIKFLKSKMELQKSGIRIEEIINNSETIFNNLESISTNSTLESKQISCINLIEILEEKYTSFRASELTYSDEDIIYKLKGKSRYNNVEFESNNFKILDIKRIYFGLSATFLELITRLTFQRFIMIKGQASIRTLCNNLETDIINRYRLVDRNISAKFKEILSQKITKLQISKSISKVSTLTNMITLNNYPTIPMQLTQQINMRLSSILGLNPITGTMGSSSGRIQLSSNTTKKIASKNFWITLKNAINDKTIFLPIGNYVNGSFSDRQFLLLDLFASCILGVPKGYINLTKNKMRSVLTKGYILFTNEPNDLSDSKKWKIIDKRTISNEFKKGIAKFRINMFNILANNMTFNNYSTMNLPYNSKISINIVLFCKNLLGKSNLKNCNILICRKQFAFGIKNKLAQYKLTKNIDFESGNAYARYSQVSPLKTNDPLRS